LRLPDLAPVATNWPCLRLVQRALAGWEDGRQFGFRRLAHVHCIRLSVSPFFVSDAFFFRTVRHFPMFII
jgi:hypothetical protein